MDPFLRGWRRGGGGLRGNDGLGGRGGIYACL